MRAISKKQIETIEKLGGTIHDDYITFEVENQEYGEHCEDEERIWIQIQKILPGIDGALQGHPLDEGDFSYIYFKIDFLPHKTTTKNQKIMKTKTSITGRAFNITANHSRRTFTIRVDGTKYRTIQMSKEEFSSARYWTGNDWNQFMKTDEYYKVKYQHNEQRTNFNTAVS